ncbi:MAG: CHASE2 domain-containing protein [Armatimonadetes bacterium]|nr:CHASE2 domain-containing protein [Armatimonadota bacterium]
MGLVALVALVVWGLAWLGAFTRIDLALHDWFARVADARRGDRPSRLLIADVSSARAESWQHDLPGGRRDLATLVTALARGGAQAIVVDVPLEVGGGHDDELAAAMLRAGNVVLRAQLTSPRPTEYALTLLPADLSRAAAGSGFALWPADLDGVVRRMATALPHVQASSLAEAAANVAGAAVPAGGGRGRTERGRTMLLNWAGPPGRGFAVQRCERLTPADMAHRIVVVGVADVTRGGYTTPLARCLRPDWLDRRPAYMSSPELLANAIESVMSGRSRHEVGLLGLAVLLVLGAAAGYAASQGERPLVSALAVPAILAFYVGLAAVLDGGELAWLPVAAPMAAMLLCAVSGASARAASRAARLVAEAEAAERERHRLVELDTAKRAVLATIVHDLRNPVTVIKGQALTLLADPEMRLGPRVHDEFLRGISVQCDRLTHTVEDLLDVDPDRSINLLVSPVDVAAVVRRVSESYSLQSRRHALRLEVEELGEVLLDESRFERILANLVSNAVKYSPKGGVVTVGLSGDPARASFCLSVRDEGIGMRPDQVERLFGLFVRVLDDPRDIPGVGVGLHSVQRLVKAHGGRLEVTSAPGQGSEFRCWLPWRTVELDHPPSLDRPPVGG